MDKPEPTEEEAKKALIYLAETEEQKQKAIIRFNRIFMAMLVIGFIAYSIVWFSLAHQ